MRRSLRLLAIVFFSCAATTWAHDGYGERGQVMQLLSGLREELRNRELSPQQLAEVRAALEQALRAVQQPSQGQGGWARPEVVSACASTFSDPGAKSECLGLAARARFDPVPAITTCENDFDGDVNELACLRLTLGAWSDPSATIGACENAFDGDANELECLRVVANARCDAPALVNACESAMDGDANELACLAAAVTAPRDPAGLVSMCEQLMSGDEAELGCIRQQVGVR